jgi:hypothetical protein
MSDPNVDDTEAADPNEPLTPLSDPDNVKFEVVDDADVPGTGFTPNEVAVILGADPSLFTAENSNGG